MGRVRNRPINAFVEELKEEYGAGDLADLSENTGIPYTQCVRYADVEDEHLMIESLYRDAILAGRTMEEFAEGLLPKLKTERKKLEAERRKRALQRQKVS